MNFYKHHIGDYAQATAHLSFVEDAAYSRMIRKYYAEEKPLPAEVKAVQRLVGARTREEKQAVEDVLEEFFELREDGWHNKRCDAELAENQSLDEDREARAANERERQRRHREERRRLFEQLRAFDIVPAWDTRTETLRKLLEDASVTPPVTQPETRDEAQQSRPVTPPVTRTATANQTPDARHQTPVKEKDRPPSASLQVVGAQVGDADAEPPQQPAPEGSLEDDPEGAMPPGVPPCPHKLIQRLWAETLPQLPQHRIWTKTRAEHLRARWRETAVQRSWTEQQQGLDYFRRLFGYVGKSRFLTGNAPPSRPGQPPFVCELEWLLLPSNWAKVIEGKYHQEAA